jgi:hypothetical protein
MLKALYTDVAIAAIAQNGGTGAIFPGTERK